MNFDLWITNRISFNIVEPKSGSTGDFDLWIAKHIPWWELQEAEEEEAVGLPSMRAIARGILRGIGRGVG